MREKFIGPLMGEKSLTGTLLKTAPDLAQHYQYHVHRVFCCFGADWQNGFELSRKLFEVSKFWCP